MGFEDYLGRKLVLKEKVFNEHTKKDSHYLNNEERRHQIFPHIKDIFLNPDEVWLYERNNNKWNIISFLKKQ